MEGECWRVGGLGREFCCDFGDGSKTLLFMEKDTSFFFELN